MDTTTSAVRLSVWKENWLTEPLKRVRFVFRRGAGEAVQAFGALENLMDLETVAALVSLDGVFAATLSADRV